MAAAEAITADCLERNLQPGEIPDVIRERFKTFDNSEASKLFRDTGLKIAKQVELGLHDNLN